MAGRQGVAQTHGFLEHSVIIWGFEFSGHTKSLPVSQAALRQTARSRGYWLGASNPAGEQMGLFSYSAVLVGRPRLRHPRPAFASVLRRVCFFLGRAWC